ncbi:polyprenyl synthetase family protein [Candidatus Paracaedibacter symbiosus]|uniref:polyprenyl synthetase family protein n=1 Tax=Candidatus Paracaedibacter symbiosus TaxID=244582 RepID=UPI000691230C|nr:farnesyl diphosphate synthase [Candidatus Paracaedibacter symbiosus]
MTKSSEKLDFQQRLREVQQRVEGYLTTLLEKSQSHEKLDAAMAYALTDGGKRLRPFLAYAVADIYDVPHEEVDSVAAAIELIHCYSLVHDDLPDMDNSCLRRGKPSVWKQFDVPTAILAGDALMTLAFQVIAEEAYLGPSTRAELVAMLACQSGAQGMVAGQMYDLFPKENNDVDAVLDMQQLKTGCLIGASCQAAAIIAGASEGEINFLKQFGRLFGLIFQITDDLLDVEGDTATTGKPVAQDACKHNLINLLGVDGAKELLAKLVSDALHLLEQLPHGGGILQALIPWVLNRSN